MKHKKTINKRPIANTITKPSEISMPGKEDGPYVPIYAEDGRVVGLIIERELRASLKAVLPVPEIQVGIAGGIVRHSFH